MENYVEQCYDEYKIFMNLEKSDSLPIILPIICEDLNKETNAPLAYVQPNNVLLPAVPLYISKHLFDYSEQFQKSIFFHEFTHIMDANLIFSNYNQKDLEALMSTYSEYHASQAELLCNIGFENVKEFRQLDLDNTFVVGAEGVEPITQNYLEPLVKALGIMDKPSNTYQNLNAIEYYRNYSLFEKTTMYYLGKRKLCENLSIKRIQNITEKNYGEFYPFIKNIELCIEKHDFRNLILAKNELWEKYISYFPCVNTKYLIENDKTL